MEYGMLNLKVKVGEPIQVGDGTYVQLVRKSGDRLGAGTVMLRFVCRQDIRVNRKVDLESIPEQAKLKLGLLNESEDQKTV